jgi:predicted enzyme related to lactoylglutathione lyase
MPDPFEALRTAPTPIDPDPAFAARLRARVGRALNPSAEGDQSMTLQTPETTERLRQGDVSYMSLLVRDLARATAFYPVVLGWQLTSVETGGARLVEGLSIPHGVASLEATRGYVGQLGPSVGPPPAPTAFLTFVVDDIRAAVERVRAAGGHSSAIEERPYGSLAMCTDDQGMLFALNTLPPGAPAPRRPSAVAARAGEVAYVTIEAIDDVRAREFYGAVLGWQFTPGRVERGWNIPEIVPMSGLSGGHPAPRVVPMYRVDDIAAAVARVRELGGSATDPVAQPYGITADCDDGQGTRFHLGQF